MSAQRGREELGAAITVATLSKLQTINWEVDGERKTRSWNEYGSRGEVGLWKGWIRYLSAPPPVAPAPSCRRDLHCPLPRRGDRLPRSGPLFLLRASVFVAVCRAAAVFRLRRVLHGEPCRHGDRGAPGAAAAPVAVALRRRHDMVPGHIEQVRVTYGVGLFVVRVLHGLSLFFYRRSLLLVVITIYSFAPNDQAQPGDVDRRPCRLGVLRARAVLSVDARRPCRPARPRCVRLLLAPGGPAARRGSFGGYA